jgi:aminoglycoside N3'-acetyltransferase
MSEQWSEARIAVDLVALGVRPGDLLMVHASLRAIGPVEGGALGLLAAIERAIGPQGSLLVTLGAADAWSWVNDHPESERAALLVDADPFDAASTPAEADVGVFAEVFRTAPGTIVSDHPEGRFGARGRLAEELLSDVPWDDYYGPGSPLARFVELGGRVLRLGADQDTVTLIHFAEHLVELEGKRRVRRHRIIRDADAPGGRRLVVVDTIDDSNGIVAWDGEDYFVTILRDHLTSDTARLGTVGAARAELLDGRALVDHAVSWMSEHLTTGEPR